MFFFFKEILLESGIMLQAALGFAVYLQFMAPHNFHLAQGAFSALAGYLILTWIAWMPGHELTSFGMGGLLAVGLYMAWDRGVMEHFRKPGCSRMIFLVASYSAMVIVEAVIHMVWGVEPVTLPFDLFQRVSVSALQEPALALNEVFVLLLSLFVLACLGAILFSPLGLKVIAFGENAQLAREYGVKTSYVKAIILFFCGLCSATTGVSRILLYNLTPKFGLEIVLWGLLITVASEPVRVFLTGQVSGGRFAFLRRLSLPVTLAVLAFAMGILRQTILYAWLPTMSAPLMLGIVTMTVILVSNSKKEMLLRERTAYPE